LTAALASGLANSEVADDVFAGLAAVDCNAVTSAETLASRVTSGGEGEVTMAVPMVVMVAELAGASNSEVVAIEPVRTAGVAGVAVVAAANATEEAMAGPAGTAEAPPGNAEGGPSCDTDGGGGASVAVVEGEVVTVAAEKWAGAALSQGVAVTPMGEDVTAAAVSAVVREPASSGAMGVAMDASATADSDAGLWASCLVVAVDTADGVGGEEPSLLSGGAGNEAKALPGAVGGVSAGISTPANPPGCGSCAEGSGVLKSVHSSALLLASALAPVLLWKSVKPNALARASPLGVAANSDTILVGAAAETAAAVVPVIARGSPTVDELGVTADGEVLDTGAAVARQSVGCGGGGTGAAEDEAPAGLMVAKRSDAGARAGGGTTKGTGTAGEGATGVRGTGVTTADEEEPGEMAIVEVITAIAARSEAGAGEMAGT